MRFPQYKYKEFNNTNKNEWALQPPTQENWNKMHNEAWEYCKKLEDIFEFDLYCKDYELPSFHPYWSFMSFKNTIKLIEETRGLISQTQKYIDSNGYYVVNAKDSIRKQKKAIIDYCKKLKFN